MRATGPPSDNIKDAVLCIAYYLNIQTVVSWKKKERKKKYIITDEELNVTNT